MISLQQCSSCGAVQYPPRELCATCLADTLERRVTDHEAGTVLATTELHHSHEPTFRERLPIRVGLVQLDSGPTVVCFLGGIGTRVCVTASLDSEGRTVLSAADATASFPAITQGES